MKQYGSNIMKNLILVFFVWGCTLFHCCFAQYQFFEEKEESNRKFSNATTGIIIVGIIAGIALIIGIIALVRLSQNVRVTTYETNVPNATASGNTTIINTPLLLYSSCKTVFGLLEPRRISSIVSYTSTTISLQIANSQAIPDSYTNPSTRKIAVYNITNALYNGESYLPVMSADFNTNIITLVKDDSGVPVYVDGAVIGAVPTITEVSNSNCKTITPIQQGNGDVTQS